MGQVCKSWNEIIQWDKQASIKRRNYRSELETSLEVNVDVFRHLMDVIWNAFGVNPSTVFK